VIAGLEGGDISPLYTDELTGFAVVKPINNVPVTAKNTITIMSASTNAFFMNTN
jgi:hypothetical protein